MKTLLSEWVLSNGGGSLLGMGDPIKGAGRVGWPAAVGAEGLWGLCNDDGSSSVSDSESESLEPESGCNKKLRVIVGEIDEGPRSTAEGLQNREKKTEV